MSTSLTVFLAICILGCDFMIYVLFHWLFGEKRSRHHSFRKRATPSQTPLYYFPAKGSSPRDRFQTVRNAWRASRHDSEVMKPANTLVSGTDVESFGRLALQSVEDDGDGRPVRTRTADLFRVREAL
jgi:hypothetical protein